MFIIKGKIESKSTENHSAGGNTLQDRPTLTLLGTLKCFVKPRSHGRKK